MEQLSPEQAQFTAPDAPARQDTPEQKPQRGKPAMEYGELSPEEQGKLVELDKQFASPQFVEISTPEFENQHMKIEYVVLDVRTDQEKAEAVKNNEHTVVHIPGYGSSLRSPDAFAKLLALREKKRVIVMSQPSTGKSDSAPKEWMKFSRKERSFAPFAESLSRAVDAIRANEAQSGNNLTTEELSVVSSSMGSIIAAEMAKAHPEKVKDLVLLHPGGVNEENVFQLARRYFPETLGSKIATKRRKPLTDQEMAEMERDYQETFGKSLQQAWEEAGGQGEFSLQDATQQETDMYRAVTKDIIQDSGANTARGRYREGLRLVLWEALTIAKGGMLQTLKDIDADTNMYIVYGSEDGLFPKEQMSKAKEALRDNPNVRTEILPMKHDEIYQRPRDYTGRVGKVLKDMAKRETEKK